MGGVALDTHQSREFYLALTLRTARTLDKFSEGIVFSQEGLDALDTFGVGPDGYSLVLAALVASEVFEQLHDEGWVTWFVEPKEVLS